jgi:glyoxylase-like metal-dependent hydrolase (beta-lactamase superfamily II)
MSTNGTRPTLNPVGDGVWAWIHPFTDRVASNAAVVLDDDGLTVIDSTGIARHHEALAHAVTGLGYPVRRLVLTHSHLDHVGGVGVIGPETTLATAKTAAALAAPPFSGPLQALQPDLAEEIAAVTNPDDVTVLEDLDITPRLKAIECSGHSPSDLVLSVPDAGVCIAGDMCFFGTVPVGFQGDFDAWASSLTKVRELGPTFIPGHGEIGTTENVEAVAAFVDAIREADDADSMPPGPWDDWRDPFAVRIPRVMTQINIERHKMNRNGEHGFPPTGMKLLAPSEG